MSNSTKALSNLDGNQTLQGSFNDVDDSLSISGFLVGKVGRKITQSISTTSSTNDTSTYNFYEGSTLLYTLKIIYTDENQTTMVSAERTA